MALPFPSIIFAGNPVALDPFEKIINVGWGNGTTPYVGFINFQSDPTDPSEEFQCGQIGTFNYRFVTPGAVTDDGDWVGYQIPPGEYDASGAGFSTEPNLAVGHADLFTTDPARIGGKVRNTTDPVVSDIPNVPTAWGNHGTGAGPGPIVYPYSGFYKPYFPYLDLGKAVKALAKSHPHLDELEIEFQLMGVSVTVLDTSNPSAPDVGVAAEYTTSFAFTSRRGKTFSMAHSTGSDASDITGGTQVQDILASGPEHNTLTPAGGTADALIAVVSFPEFIQHLFINVHTGKARWGSPSTSTATGG